MLARTTTKTMLSPQPGCASSSRPDTSRLETLTNEASLELQPKFLWRIMHAVEKRVAGRAEHPHHLRPFAVLRRSPCAVAPRMRLVSNVEHPRLPARFAGRWRIRVRPTKTDQVSFGEHLGLRSGAVDRFAVWSAQMKRAHRTGVARAATLRRAQPLIVLTFPDWKHLSALTAGVLLRSRALSLPPARLASSRAILSMRVRSRQFGSAFDTGRFLQHGDARDCLGLLQRRGPVRLRVGREFNGPRAYRQGRRGLSSNSGGQSR